MGTIRRALIGLALLGLIFSVSGEHSEVDAGSGVEVIYCESDTDVFWEHGLICDCEVERCYDMQTGLLVSEIVGACYCYPPGVGGGGPFS